MKNFRCGWLAALSFLAAITRAAPPATEDFSHEPAFTDLKLSPDGKMVAYSETIRGDHRIYLLDLKTKKKIGLELLGDDTAIVHRSSYFWANNQRFVYSVSRTGTYTAIDRSGRNGTSNIKGGRLLYLYRDEEYGKMLMTGQDIDLVDSPHERFFYPNRPYVQQINPSLVMGIGSGISADEQGTNITTRMVENPGNVVDWIVTPQGEVSAAKAVRGTTYHVLYRASDKDPWSDLPGLGWNDPEAYPLGFSADAATLYVGRVSPGGTWGVYPYDLNKRSLGETILVDQRYDIVHPVYTPVTNGISQQALVFSPKERALLGIRYVTEYPRVLWLDPGMAQVQAALDQALPNKINTMVNFSDDLDRIIVLSWTAQDPGAYYLFDRGTRQLEKLLSRMPWLNEASLADVKPFRFRARDGVVINGYLTVPPGKSLQNLPTVVLVEDYMNRLVWGFDPVAQFLASHGYAVLQVDPRGTAGHGVAFYHLGSKQAGRGAQADISDATRWAIAQKIVDPAHVTIMGWGRFGGYFAVTSLMADPGLYCCGVDQAGATDWAKVMDKGRIMPDYYLEFAEKFGDPELSAEAAVLKANSPLFNAVAVRDPLLVMHDKLDMKWTYNQSKDLAEAMKQAGRSVEFKNDYDERYGYQTMAKYLNDALGFIQKHMPADAAPK
jgi:dipeptidyl aminopeptidase/acylaminoacyl peptidase